MVDRLPILAAYLRGETSAWRRGPLTYASALTTPAGKFMRSLFASLAEYDRESILAKTKVGQQLAAAQGGCAQLCS